MECKVVYLLSAVSSFFIKVEPYWNVKSNKKVEELEQQLIKYIARLKKATKIDDLVVPTLYTTGSTQISQLLRTLREQHHHLAVVVDEYGGTEGLYKNLYLFVQQKKPLNQRLFLFW